MKKNLFLMIDLETYGTNTDAVVREISIMPFSLDPPMKYSGAAIDLFPITDIQKKSGGRTTDNATIQWWNTKPQADAIIKEKERAYGLSPHKAAAMVSKYIEKLKKKYTLAIVGRGITTFDYPILKSFLMQYGFDFKIPFYKIYDLRSLTSLYKVITGVDLTQITPQIATHIAIDDCNAQIEQIFEFARRSGVKMPAIEEDMFTSAADLSSIKKESWEESEG